MLCAISGPQEGEVPPPLWLSNQLSSQAPPGALGLVVCRGQERWRSSVPPGLLRCQTHYRESRLWMGPGSQTFLVRFRVILGPSGWGGRA